VIGWLVMAAYFAGMFPAAYVHGRWMRHTDDVGDAVLFAIFWPVLAACGVFLFPLRLLIYCQEKGAMFRAKLEVFRSRPITAKGGTTVGGKTNYCWCTHTHDCRAQNCHDEEDKLKHYDFHNEGLRHTGTCDDYVAGHCPPAQEAGRLPFPAFRRWFHTISYVDGPDGKWIDCQWVECRDENCRVNEHAVFAIVSYSPKPRREEASPAQPQKEK